MYIDVHLCMPIPLWMLVFALQKQNISGIEIGRPIDEQAQKTGGWM